MNKKENIQQMIDAALSSIDNTKRATPQPFLFTRILARMNAAKETSWEKTGRLISRPSFAIAGLSALILLNILVITLHHPANNSGDEQASFVTTGDFSSANTTINDIVNSEP